MKCSVHSLNNGYETTGNEMIIMSPSFIGGNGITDGIV